MVLLVISLLSLHVQANPRYYFNDSMEDEGFFEESRKPPLTELDIMIKEVEWAEAAARRHGGFIFCR